MTLGRCPLSITSRAILIQYHASKRTNMRGKLCERFVPAFPKEENALVGRLATRRAHEHALLEGHDTKHALFGGHDTRKRTCWETWMPSRTQDASNCSAIRIGCPSRWYLPNRDWLSNNRDCLSRT